MSKSTRIITLTITLFIVLGCYSQNKTIDSFQQEINKHIQKDTIRVNLLNKFASKIYTTNIGKTEKLLNESEKLATTLNYNKGKLDCYLQLGKLYNTAEQYEKALIYEAKGTSIAKKLNLPNYKRAFFLLLSETYYNKSHQDTIEAKDFLAELKYKIFLRDSLNKTSQRESSLKETVKTKDNELLLTRLENFLWIAGVIVLILLLGFVLTWMNARKIKMQNKQLLTEQKLRRSQMNPHFIFNSIQNVRSLINNKQDAEAVNYINKFSALTRQILESSDESYTSLTEEINLIENYIALQQLLYTNKFTYTITVDEAIDTDTLFLPPMLSQPFIENAIKHGLSHKAQNGLLKIRFYLKKKSLIFEVIDNGSGFDDSKKPDNHKSMAMEITKKRLAHYSKNNDFVVHADTIIDEYKNSVGAKVSFEIPYIYEN